MRHRSIAVTFLFVLFTGVCIALPAQAIERPFVLWDKTDLAHIKKQIETDEWAKKQFNAKPDNWAIEALHDLIRYHCYGDKEAGEQQKKKLMQVINSKPPLGGALWVDVVRYDMLFDMLSDTEKKKIDEVFRRYIKHAVFENALFDPKVFNDERNFSRYDAKYYRRDNWLPNITWPRRISANLMAAALADDKLIRKTWNHYGSIKHYFDTQLADWGFYGEEFSKMGSTPGEMIVYCLAVKRLGMNDLGFGYRGRHGATMRGHIRTVIDMGFPQVDLHSDRPHYPMITIGDLRGSGSSRRDNLGTFAFQHSIVRGYLPGEKVTDAKDSAPGIHKWQAHGAWGGRTRGNHPQWDGYSNFTPKMQIPLWFELAHKLWPEDGYGYFLAQMRTPAQDAYIPSLVFGLKPIKPGDVKPPRANSWIAPQRGLVMLRAEESPSYWESPKPAVALRTASPYAHSVWDNFALVGYYAFNRPIYLNRQATPGYARSWTRSVLSHAGVMVNGEPPRFSRATTTREGLHPPVKHLAAMNDELYDDLGAARGVMLTDQYLLDVYALRDQSKGNTGKSMDHPMHWTIHGLGVVDLLDEQNKGNWSKSTVSLEGQLASFGKARIGQPGDKAWSVTMVQRCALPEGVERHLPKAWYERGVGVRLTMLGGQTTRVYLAETPTRDEPKDAPALDKAPIMHEVGGVSVIAERKAPSSTFITLHEPFEGGKPAGLEIESLYETRDEQGKVIAVKITGPQGSGVNDRCFMNLATQGPSGGVAVLTDDEKFLYRGYLFIRIHEQRVEAWGDLRGLEMNVGPKVKAFTLNDRPVPHTIEGGLLKFNTVPTREEAVKKADGR